MIDRTYKEKIVLITCLLGVLGAAPFTAYRFINGHYLLAFIDLFLMVSLSAIAYCTWKTRNVEIPATILVASTLATFITILHLGGPYTAYTIFPITMASFCLISPRAAAILNLITMLLMFPAFYGVLSTYEIVIIYTSLIILSLFSYAFTLLVNRQQYELIRLAARDGLTGAWNRKTLELALVEIFNKHQYRPVTASLIILDFDFFKSINDTHRHGVGDEILKETVKLLSGIMRVSDQIYRYRDEEFVLIAEGTGLKEAGSLAEMIRSRVEKSQFHEDQKVTVSVGVAELAQAQSEDEWLALADETLNRAKSEGRNRCHLSNELTSTNEPALAT